MNTISFGKGCVEIPKNIQNISQIVTTSKGKKIPIPNKMGSTTKVRPLENGDYEVTTQYSVYGSKPRSRVLSENEFVSEYDNNGTKLDILG